MPMLLFCRPRSTKYFFRCIRQDQETPFKNLIDTLPANHPLDSQAYTNAKDQNFIKEMHRLLVVLHGDKVKGEFDGEEIRLVEELEDAINKVNRQMVSSNDIATEWWNVPSNAAAFEGLVSVLDKIYNSRTTSAKLWNIAWQCYDCSLDSQAGWVLALCLSLSGVLVPGVGAALLSASASIGATTGTAVTFKALFCALGPNIVNACWLTSAGFSLFFKNHYEKGRISTAISNDITEMRKESQLHLP